MDIVVEKYKESDIPEMVRIWDQVVTDGRAFPQTEPLDISGGKEFFSFQSLCAVARDRQSGKVNGLYILHPNNQGRCGHICNCSYAVDKDLRGCGIGELLVKDSLAQGKALGFRIMQFNAVAASNAAAIKLYKKLGFVQLGVIPGGFRRGETAAAASVPDNYEDIILFYHIL